MRWMAVVGMALAGALLLGAEKCQPPNPQPTPTPCTTCPAGSHCEGGVCVTDPIPPTPDPSPVCEPGATCGCWHRPPGEPWQKLPDCPPPTPTCPAECPAGTSCTDPSAGCVPTPPEPSEGCVIAGEPTETIPGYPAQYGNRVNAAIVALYPTCTVGARCVVTERPQAFQAAVATKLRAGGLCAGQHTPSTDEIAVAERSTAPWEGYHIYSGPGWDDPTASGTVVWAPGSARVTWKAPGTGPIPPPQVSCTGCPAPCTPKVVLWGLVYRNRWWDCTPKFSNRDTVTWGGQPVTGYCVAIGMADRLYCPARQEGDPNRRACEGVGIGGYAAAVPLWRCEQGVPEVNPDNPFQARCATGWVEVCATDGTSCTRGTL